MPYLVAKNFYQHGCYAMPVEHGPELVELKRDLQAATPLEHLQLVTISRPAAYGEYAPYTIVKDRDEFIRLVLQMKSCQADDDDVRKISEQLIEKTVSRMRRWQSEALTRMRYQISFPCGLPQSISSSFVGLI